VKKREADGDNKTLKKKKTKKKQTNIFILIYIDILLFLPKGAQI
jgi:hypothetical protein